MPRVAGLQAVKCLRLTSGKVNFLHVYGSISMKHKVLGNCYKAKIIFTIIFARGDQQRTEKTSEAT